MVPNPTAPLPHHPHPSLTLPLTPSAAQALLATYLQDSQTTAWRHPDSLLRASGIAYPPHAGPQGGLALHHLRRIEAGLRGENLVTETVDELVEKFGDEAAAGAAGGALLPEGDDKRLDALIAGEKGGVKRKRFRDESRVDAWAEDTAAYGSSSEAAFGDVARRGGVDGEWQDRERYARSQEVLEEVGDREPAAGAPVVRSETKLLHDDKAARRAAKKEKRKAEKKEREAARKEEG